MTVAFPVLKEQYLDKPLEVHWLNNGLICVNYGTTVNLTIKVLEQILTDGKYEQKKYVQMPSMLSGSFHKVNAFTENDYITVTEDQLCKFIKFKMDHKIWQSGYTPDETDRTSRHQLTLPKSKWQKIYDLVKLDIKKQFGEGPVIQPLIGTIEPIENSQ